MLRTIFYYFYFNYNIKRGYQPSQWSWIFYFLAKFWELVPDIVALTLSEMVVDETKHAFITKFNNIPSKVYKEYTALLANDVITSRKKNVSMP